MSASEEGPVAVVNDAPPRDPLPPTPSQDLMKKDVPAPASTTPGAEDQSSAPPSTSFMTPSPSSKTGGGGSSADAGGAMTSISPAQSHGEAATRQQLEAIPTLVRLAAKALRRKPELLGQRKYKDREVPEHLIRVIWEQSLTRHTLAPAIMLKIQDNIPSLRTQAIDKSYWKSVVNNEVECPIDVPFPQLCLRLAETGRVLDAYCEAVEGGKSAPTEHHEIEKTLKMLMKIPPSVELLREVRMVPILKKLGKCSEASIAKLATDVKKHWKAVLEADVQATAVSGEQGVLPCNEDEDAMPTELELGKLAVQVQTWRQVYEFAEEYGRRKRMQFGKRALAMKQDAESKRHKTVAMGIVTDKTAKGKVITPQKATQTTVDRVRKTLGMTATVKKTVKDGGLILQKTTNAAKFGRR